MPRKHYFHKKKQVELTPLATRILKGLLIWVLQIVLVVGAAYLIASNMFEKTKMLGNSMHPTIENEKVIVVNKWAYLLKGPKRFDVIVYKQSNKEHSYFEVKRVVALPGETILMKEGSIFINGNKIEETVNVIPDTNGGLAEDGITLGENEYFVLGDNREESEDSRFADSGNILRSEIIGKAFFIEKPFSFVDGLNKNKK